MNGVSSKFRFFGLWVLLLVSILRAQVPNYDLNPWTGDSFEEKSEPFFEMLALQTTAVRTTISSDEGRLVIGLQLSGGTSSSGNELGLLSGKGGVFPTLEGDYWVAGNLRLQGTFTGFETSDDIVFANSYGFTYRMGEEEQGKWLLSFLRSRMEGPDDFFFKCLVVSIGRKINYNDISFGLGTGLALYNSGIHISGVEEGSFSKRMEGAVGMLTLRGDKKISSHLEAGMELRLSPTSVSVSLGLYGLL
ncbi:MAG: hypothetical protein CMG27_00135 [Candidatus Marinimicrobia bacterium]|nr:hypothetical protein [Candidatus Neomarinimicrobiota bacterium]